MTTIQKKKEKDLNNNKTINQIKFSSQEQQKISPENEKISNKSK